MRSIGGYDFVAPSKTASAVEVQWTPRALPRVIVLTTAPEHLADPQFRLVTAPLKDALAGGEGERWLRLGGSVHRVHIDNAGTGSPAVLVPFDHLFDIRITAAIRLWRALSDRKPGRDPGALSAHRRKRLVLALRALDARLEDATYRDIAVALFGRDRLPRCGWKTHDLRDRTIRLTRLGFHLMKGGYRDLLLHPYRHKTNYPG